MAVALTAGAYIAERKQGLLDRSMVAGMRRFSITLNFYKFKIIELTFHRRENA